MPRQVDTMHQAVQLDWASRAEMMKQQAEAMPTGRERDALLKMAAKLEHASQISEALRPRPTREQR